LGKSLCANLWILMVNKILKRLWKDNNFPLKPAIKMLQKQEQKVPCWKGKTSPQQKIEIKGSNKSKKNKLKWI
jgi:hypothetical protein